VPIGGRTEGVRNLLSDLNLHTVCQSAHCPNECECFSRGTATFMILGNTCTRDCRFCAVRGGEPDPVDPDEPAHVAEAVRRLGLRYVVVTSVTRDDLPDGGAGHFTATVRAIRETTDAQTEVLTPDFRGDAELVDVVLDAEPTVYNHNVETVPRLYDTVRPLADYHRSLSLLNQVARSGRSVPKSGIMVGLGETDDEILATMTDLVDAGCRMLTIGQYLAPSREHLPVARFVEPERFDALRDEGFRRGLDWVVSGPFVRSSYCAEAAFESASISVFQGEPAM
jgi:lipoic acid synthetase